MYYGVYRVFKNGNLRFVSRTATANQKLAEEIARDLNNGELVMPDGRVVSIPKKHTYVVKEIGNKIPS